MFRMATDDDELRFCWDEAKAASNLDKHGVSFEAATFVFDDPMRLEPEDVFARCEYRNIVIGQVDGVVWTVVYTAPGGRPLSHHLRSPRHRPRA
jgi:uncharacterized DUF497 family protein